MEHVHKDNKDDVAETMGKGRGLNIQRNETQVKPLREIKGSTTKIKQD